jgi:CLIP-associating protein 1/2
MSQPGSRSTSPASRLDYITYRQPEIEPTPTSLPPAPVAVTRIVRPASAASVTGSNGHAGRSSRIPRSRGHSRETSPSRAPLETSFRPVGDAPLLTTLQQQQSLVPLQQRRNVPGPLSLQQLQRGTDFEAAMSEALLAKAKAPADSGRRDDASETSSISSESRSVNGIPMDVPDIIAHISSGSWSDRRDGLVSLQMFLKNDGQMSPFDARKMTEMFTRMFHDPSPKVFGIFLETIPRFVQTHAADVSSDWLFVCLSRLLGRLASEQLSSIIGRVSKALKAVREEFPVDDQLNALSRFVCESAKINDAKARTVFLEYLHDLAVSMDSSELVNSSNVQQLAIRVIAWTSEPKCSGIRRLSQNVVIALFNVNTPEFYAILNALPRSMRVRQRSWQSAMFAV